eukprot:6123168-Amphidinium_carterae.1
MDAMKVHSVVLKKSLSQMAQEFIQVQEDASNKMLASGGVDGEEADEGLRLRLGEIQELMVQFVVGLYVLDVNARNLQTAILGFATLDDGRCCMDSEAMLRCLAVLSEVSDSRVVPLRSALARSLLPRLQLTELDNPSLVKLAGDGIGSPEMQSATLEEVHRRLADVTVVMRAKDWDGLVSILATVSRGQERPSGAAAKADRPLPGPSGFVPRLLEVITSSMPLVLTEDGVSAKHHRLVSGMAALAAHPDA